MKEEHENYFFHLDPNTEIKQNSQISDDIKHLYLDESHMTKLCKASLTCIAVHPGKKKLIVAGGSRWGELGLFMPGKRKVTIRLEPHTNTVSELVVVSCLVTAQFECLMLRRCNLMRFIPGLPLRLSLNLLMLLVKIMFTSSDGQVININVRENKKVCAYPTKEDHSEYGTLWGLHHNKFDMNYFLTTSNNAKISAWDHRNTKKPVDVNKSHGKTVKSARFDPIRGKRIVTTGHDDKFVSWSSLIKQTYIMFPKSII